MPNCDFYALKEDLRPVLDFVFEASGCRVFEHYSPFDSPLAEFHTIAEIEARYPLGICMGTAPSVLLQLLPASAGRLVMERIALDPAKCGGATFRYVASGWGMIQLQLGGMSSQRIVMSHTNHNSKRRARAWEPTCADALGPVSDWDWTLVERTSRRINAQIRKLASEKIGSRPILPAAATAIAAGARAA